MSFGLTNAPTAFMNLRNRVFEEYLHKIIIVFIDNMLEYLRTINKHELHLKIALEKLIEKKLYAKFSKCEFWLRQVSFLEHVIFGEGISVDMSKIEAVSQWKQPTKAIEVRSFLGLVGYY